MGVRALGLVVVEPQIRSPALAEILGGRRLWTVFDDLGGVDPIE
jgi:hypothetical protein